MSKLRSNQATSFIPLPEGVPPFLHWPTDNTFLFREPDRYFARTRINANYGRPGWTRDAGKRFHRGCDIAPLHVVPDNQLHTVTFTDPATGNEFESQEPGWIPTDTLYAVADGTVVETNDNPTESTLGSYVILAHRWPERTDIFYSLYAHLNEVLATVGSDITCGKTIGKMGQTSSSADAREWMAIAPHLHLEFYDAQGASFDPELLLKRYLISK